MKRNFSVFSSLFYHALFIFDLIGVLGLKEKGKCMKLNFYGIDGRKTVFF